MYRGRRQCAHGQQQRWEVEQQQRHAAWVATYEAIHPLPAQGLSVTTIAEHRGVSRPTVYAYLRRATPPSPRSPQRSGQVLRPSMAYLIQRWREGCTDSRQLWRELRARGYGHSARSVSRFLTRRRRASEAGWAPETQTSPSTRPQGPSARAVSFTWVCPAAKRAQDAQMSMDQLTQANPVIAQAYTLSQAFLTLVRERRGDALEAWMAKVAASGIDPARPLCPRPARSPRGGQNGAPLALEQWSRRGLCQPPEAAQAPGLWTGRRRALTAACDASGLDAAVAGRPAQGPPMFFQTMAAVAMWRGITRAVYRWKQLSLLSLLSVSCR